MGAAGSGYNGGMNLLAFILAVVCGVIGVVEVIQSRARSLTAWALIAISIALVVQCAFVDWSHTVHT